MPSPENPQKIAKKTILKKGSAICEDSSKITDPFLNLDFSGMPDHGMSPAGSEE